MTDKPTITQADRDAAADLYLINEGSPYSLHDRSTAAEIQTGEHDHWNEVEAFAKHRESSVAELQAEVERMREALKTISMMHDGNPSDIMADMPIADYREVVIGEMKKEARAALAQKEPVE